MSIWILLAALAISLASIGGLVYMATADITAAIDNRFEARESSPDTLHGAFTRAELAPTWKRIDQLRQKAGELESEFLDDKEWRTESLRPKVDRQMATIVGLQVDAIEAEHDLDLMILLNARVARGEITRSAARKQFRDESRERSCRGDRGEMLADWKRRLFA